jgi:ornithine cyclodeaminase
MENPPDVEETVLLIMPAWEPGGLAGIKTVTVSPENAKQGGPSILGVYSLIDTRTGQPLAMMDGPMITARRTAAASALASSYLSKKTASSMLMIGTGVLAEHLIEAHRSVRQLDKVYIWGRSFEKAKVLADKVGAKAIEDRREVMSEADIITAATMTTDPLVHGELLRPGQHIDLIGAYRPDRREADDEVIRWATVFVDTFETALHETGDIVQPMASGLLKREDMPAEMADLCRGDHPGRTCNDQITLFKSCGAALEDLAAAKMVWNASAGRT